MGAGVFVTVGCYCAGPQPADVRIGAMAMRRRRILGVSSVAALVVLGTVVGCTQARQQAVQLPPKAASAKQVLEVYLHAAKIHDCATTKAIAYDANERDQTWCGGNGWSLFGDNPTLLAYKNFGKEFYVPKGEGEYAPEVCIPVDIWQKDTDGATPGELPGWEFCMHHTVQGWRLAEEGYG